MGRRRTDNFITAIHDALIKNQGTVLYDHPALAERFEFAAGCDQRDLLAAQGSQVPQWRAGHP